MYRIKLSIVLIRALMIREYALIINVILGPSNPEDPSDKTRIIHEFFSRVLFKGERDAEISIVEVKRIVPRRVLSLRVH